MYAQRIAKAREQVQSLLAEVKAITAVAESENREFSEDESARLEAITGDSGEITALTANIDKWSKAESAINTAMVQINAMHNSQSVSGSASAIKVPARARTGGRLVAFKGPEAEANAYASGRFLQATLGNHSDSMQWCREHGVITNAMGGVTDSAGGFLVPPEMEAAIVNLKESFGVFGRYCRNVPMTSDNLLVPRVVSGLTAYAVAEAAAITESDATLGQVSLSAAKFATLTRISSELSEDSIISMADFLVREIAYAHAVKEDACGFLGDGSAGVGGIEGLTTALLAGSKVAAAAGLDTAPELTIEVFQAAVAKLPQYAGIMPMWFVNSAVYWNVMARLQLAAGGNNAVDLGNGPVMQFMGYPVVFAQTLPATIAASTKFAYFGDLSMTATKGNRRGVTIAADSSRFFEFDQIAIKSTMRYDIAVHEVGTGSVAGPMVELAAGTA